MTVGDLRVRDLARGLLDLNPAVRDDTCGTITDWVGSFDMYEARLLAMLLSIVAVVEIDPVARESELHAVAELSSVGLVDIASVAPLTRLDLKTLDVTEQEYVQSLLSPQN